MQETGPQTEVTRGIRLGMLLPHTHVLPQPVPPAPTTKGQGFLDTMGHIPPGEKFCYVPALLKPIVDGVIYETMFGDHVHRSLATITGSDIAARALLRKACFRPSGSGVTLNGATVENYNRTFAKHLVKLAVCMDTDNVGDPPDRDALRAAANFVRRCSTHADRLTIMVTEARVNRGSYRDKGALTCAYPC